MRSGAIVQNYGDTRVSNVDYGNGLMAAADAMTNGDELHVGPGTYEIDDLKFKNGSQLNNCRIFFNRSVLFVANDQDHDYSVYLYGNNNLLEGMTLDANRSGRDWLTYVNRNEGFRLYGNENIIRNCTVRDTPTNKDANGSYRHNFMIVGDDNLIEGCNSYSPGYSSFRNNGDRNTYRNIRSFNDQTLAHVDFHHTGTAEMLTIDGAYFYGAKGWLIDPKTGATTIPLRKVYLNNVHTFVTNHVESEQPCKLADTYEIYATNCSWRHLKATYAQEFSPNTQNTMKISDTVERMYFKNCHWDSWISTSALNASNQPRDIIFDECQFGLPYDGNICADTTARDAIASPYEGLNAFVLEDGDWDDNIHQYDGSSWARRAWVPTLVIYKAFAARLTFNRCRINCQTAVVSHESVLPSTAADVWTFTNNDIYLPDGSGKLINVTTGSFLGTATYSGNTGINGTLTEP